MLSCSCSDDYESWYIPADDFAPLNTVRSRKCASCGERIPVGALALRLWGYRQPRGDYEESRFGDEVPIADLFYCEECGEIDMNLRELGYCLNVGDKREDLQEYWKMTGFDPKRYEEPVP